MEQILTNNNLQLISTYNYSIIHKINKYSSIIQMQIMQLNQQQMIQNIRRMQQDIFSSGQQQSQISYFLSESQSRSQYRIAAHARAKNSKKSQNMKHFTQHKANNQKYSSYVSPYSQGQLNQIAYKMRVDPSTRQKSRKKIFQLIKQQERFDAQKQRIKKQRQNSNSKYKNIKPKYLAKQPIFKNVQQIQKSIYGRIKTESEHILKKYSASKQEVQQKWQGFIKKSNQWEQARQASRIKAKVCQSLNISQQMKVRKIVRQPPKMSTEECLHKLRRQAQKLKQKLNMYTFQPKIYQTQRKKYKISKSNSRSNSKSKSRSKSKTTQKKKYKQTDHSKSDMLNTNYQNNPQSNSKLNYYNRHTQKKFTVINNPRKQLQFMFS